jgi:hypothetical protein
MTQVSAQPAPAGPLARGLRVTPEHLARCHRCFDADTSEVSYVVESESSDARYRVQYALASGFRCTCPAGLDGFRCCPFNTVCKHCRWCVAHDAQYRRANPDAPDAHSPFFPATTFRRVPVGRYKAIRSFGWKVRTFRGLGPSQIHILPFAPTPPVEWLHFKHDPRYDKVILYKSGKPVETITRRIPPGLAPLNHRNQGFSLLR